MIRSSDAIVIIGAGPTGLGAAWRLQERGHSNWLLLDAAPAAGGLARSIMDDKGFTWDMGGHVLFSHYDYFDRLMDGLLPDQWVEHERESWVYMRERFIPYPLQNNIGGLPRKDLMACLLGIINAKFKTTQGAPADFEDWIMRHFGTGLADVFMRPYNMKVWAYAPKTMSHTWIGERVSTIQLRRILKNILLHKQETSWGPNSRFRFPKYGGTGSIWTALAKRLPPEHLRLGVEVLAIRVRERQLLLSDGSQLHYDRLLSTIPLDQLLIRCPELPLGPDMPKRFKHSSSHIIGVGLKGQPPEHLRTKCWMYFPEPNVPFYRVTVFSNYSSYNVPEPGKQWSLMCEVSESPDKPVDGDRITHDVLQGLRAVGFMKTNDEPVSLWHQRLEYGYPTPFLGRDACLNEIDPLLQSSMIWSRGRFGGWKYEVSNQDHSLMQGVEAVDAWMSGEREMTYHEPDVVNARSRPQSPRTPR